MANSFEALLCKAECRADQWRNRQPRLSDEHVVWVFTCLMLRERVREAICFVTDRTRGGVLKPGDIDAKSGKCVLDCRGRNTLPLAGLLRMHLSDLPSLVDVDVTSFHVEQVTHRLKGNGGPGGANSYHWKCFLLHYGLIALN